MRAVAARAAVAIIEVRPWLAIWLCSASAVLVAGNSLNLSPSLQFYLAVPLAAIAGIVCLIVVVEKA